MKKFQASFLAGPSNRIVPPSNRASSEREESRERISVFDRLGNRSDHTAHLLSAEHGLRLPAVSAGIREKLLDKSKYVDFSDLLPKNRALAADSTTNKFTFLQHGTDLAVVPSTKKETVASFPVWSRCFALFAAYRMSKYPEQSLPLYKYLDLISLFADPERGYSTSQWLNYDKQFRIYAAQYPDDLTAWTQVHEYAYRECISNPKIAAISPAVASGTSRTNKMSKATCNECGEMGHFARLCPQKESAAPQLFRNGPVGDGEICRKYNAGYCFSTNCPRRHVCSECSQAGHTRRAHGFVNGLNASQNPPQNTRSA